MRTADPKIKPARSILLHRRSLYEAPISTLLVSETKLIFDVCTCSLVFSDDAYKRFLHGIAARKLDTPGQWGEDGSSGEPLRRGTRLSLTVRHVLNSKGHGDSEAPCR